MTSMNTRVLLRTLTLTGILLAAGSPLPAEETKTASGDAARQVFKGKARVIGKNVLRLNYDFSDQAQLEDFDPFSAEGKIVDGELELTPRMPRTYFFWNLKNAIFEDSVTADMQVSLPPTSDAEVCVSAFFTHETWSGYRFALHYNDGDPSGGKARYVNVIRKEAEKTEKDWDKTHNLGTAAKPVIEAGRKYRWKIVARQGTLQMFLDNAPLVAKQDGAFRKGLVRFGGWGGPVRFDNLQIEGQVNADWLRKAFSEAETLAGREKMSELQQKDEPFRVARLSAESRETFARLNPGAVKAYSAGFRLQLMGDYDKAIEQYTAALAPEPSFAAALVRRGQCYSEKGDEDKAQEDLTKAIGEKADFYEAYKELGDVLVGRGRFDEALKDYDKALEIKPGFGAALAARGYVDFSLGRREDALREVDAALKASPDDSIVKKIHRNLTRAAAGPPWRKDKTFARETDHYVVKTDISDKAAAFYAMHLEAIRRLYTEKLGFKPEGKEKARVYLFETKEGYMTYAELSTDDRPEFTSGYYHPHYRELLLYDDLKREQSLRVLYHEGFHQFLHQILPKPPYWFNEGVAEFFGASKVEGGQVTATGLVQEGRLDNVRAMLEMKTSKPFAEIINAPPREFYGGGPEEISLRYAQAWSMVHFLFRFENGKYLPLLRDYYKSLREGAGQGDAFKAAFAKANLTQMEKEWKEYVKKLGAPKPGKK